MSSRFVSLRVVCMTLLFASVALAGCTTDGPAPARPQTEPDLSLPPPASARPGAATGVSAENKGAGTVQVHWNVPYGDGTTKSFVEFGPGQEIGRRSEEKLGVGQKSAELPNLLGGTLYSYRIVIVYAEEIYRSDPLTITTVGTPGKGTLGPQPLSVADVNVADVNPTGAVLSWRAAGGHGKVVDTWVEWGPHDGYGLTGPKEGGEGTFRYLLSDLAPGMTYHFRIVGEEDGELVLGPAGQFTTPFPDAGIFASSATIGGVGTAAVDNTPPVITGVATTGITSTGALVTWDVQDDSGSSATHSWVAYGPTGGTLDKKSKVEYGLGSRLALLEGLQNAVTYDYQVFAKDPSGKVSFSAVQTFTTNAGAGSCPTPTISNFQAGQVTPTTAQIFWDVTSSCGGILSRLEYSKDLGFAQSSNPILGVGTKVITITGLDPESFYNFRIFTVNQAGASSYSTSIVVATPPVPKIQNIQVSNILTNEFTICYDVVDAPASATSFVRYGKAGQNPVLKTWIKDMPYIIGNGQQCVTLIDNIKPFPVESYDFRITVIAGTVVTALGPTVHTARPVEVRIFGTGASTPYFGYPTAVSQETFTINYNTVHPVLFQVVNQGSVVHNWRIKDLDPSPLVLDDSFKTPNLIPNGGDHQFTYSVTFEPGQTYEIECTKHPQMQGVIVT